MTTYQIQLKRTVVEYSTSVIVYATTRAEAKRKAIAEANDGAVDWCDSSARPPIVTTIEVIDGR